MHSRLVNNFVPPIIYCCNQIEDRHYHESERGVEDQPAGGTWHAQAELHHECGLCSSYHHDSPAHVHVGRIALPTMDSEALVQDSGEDARHRRGLWNVDPHRAGSPIPALDPAVGRAGATLLCHVSGVLSL